MGDFYSPLMDFTENIYESDIVNMNLLIWFPEPRKETCCLCVRETTSAFGECIHHKFCCFKLFLMLGTTSRELLVTLRV